MYKKIFEERLLNRIVETCKEESTNSGTYLNSKQERVQFSLSKDWDRIVVFSSKSHYEIKRDEENSHLFEKITDNISIDAALIEKFL